MSRVGFDDLSFFFFFFKERISNVYFLAVREQVKKGAFETLLQSIVMSLQKEHAATVL
jgi:hypothetical protein